MLFQRKYEIPYEYNGKSITIPVIYSNRKSLSLEVTPDLEIKIKAPKGIPFRIIQDFVQKKYDWIDAKLTEYEQSPKRISLMLSNEAKNAYKKQARAVITSYVTHYAGILSVTYGRIFIKEQKTCWGSCSSKRNLNFNWKLILMPEEILEYVVVHELAHLFEMNHSKAFWGIVESILPDYKERRKWLNENGKYY